MDESVEGASPATCTLSCCFLSRLPAIQGLQLLFVGQQHGGTQYDALYHAWLIRMAGQLPSVGDRIEVGERLLPAPRRLAPLYKHVRFFHSLSHFAWHPAGVLGGGAGLVLGQNYELRP